MLSLKIQSTVDFSLDTSHYHGSLATRKFCGIKLSLKYLNLDISKNHNVSRKYVRMYLTHT
jgi:hypothetical protein